MEMIRREVLSPTPSASRYQSPRRSLGEDFARASDSIPGSPFSRSSDPRGVHHYDGLTPNTLQYARISPVSPGAGSPGTVGGVSMHTTHSAMSSCLQGSDVPYSVLHDSPVANTASSSNTKGSDSGHYPLLQCDPRGETRVAIAEGQADLLRCRLNNITGTLEDERSLWKRERAILTDKLEFENEFAEGKQERIDLVLEELRTVEDESTKHKSALCKNEALTRDLEDKVQKHLVLTRDLQDKVHCTTAEMWSAEANSDEKAAKLAGVESASVTQQTEWTETLKRAEAAEKTLGGEMHVYQERCEEMRRQISQLEANVETARSQKYEQLRRQFAQLESSVESERLEWKSERHRLEQRWELKREDLERKVEMIHADSRLAIQSSDQQWKQELTSLERSAEVARSEKFQDLRRTIAQQELHQAELTKERNEWQAQLRHSKLEQEELSRSIAKYKQSVEEFESEQFIKQGREVALSCRLRASAEEHCVELEQKLSSELQDAKIATENAQWQERSLHLERKEMRDRLQGMRDSEMTLEKSRFEERGFHSEMKQMQKKLKEVEDGQGNEERTLRARLKESRETASEERALRIQNAEMHSAQSAAQEALVAKLREELSQAKRQKEEAVFAVQVAEDRERVADHLWESTGELRGAYGSFFPLRFYHPTLHRVAKQSPVSIQHKRLSHCSSDTALRRIADSSTGGLNTGFEDIALKSLPESSSGIAFRSQPDQSKFQKALSTQRPSLTY